MGEENTELKHKNVLFIHLPKTGGTSFSNLLRPYCDEQSLRYYSPFGPSKDANLHATAYDYIYSYYNSSKLINLSDINILQGFMSI